MKRSRIRDLPGTSRFLILHAAGCVCLTGRIPEHDAGLNFYRLPVLLVRLELPLQQRIGNGFGLLGEGTDHMNVLYLTVPVNDDSDGNWIEFAVGNDRVNPLQNVIALGIILNADWRVLL